MTRLIYRVIKRRPAAQATEAQQRAARKAELDDLRLQLAHGETCIRVAAERRGVTTAALKRLVYGGAA